MGSTILENPENHPLDKLYFNAKDNGVSVKIPALNEKWVEKRVYTKFLPLSFDLDKPANSSELDEWLSESDWFNRDLEWLLGLKHHQFWSHMIYDKGCITTILSFLQDAPPAYIRIKSIINDERVHNIYSSIMKNILSVICRLVTNKESEGEWMTTEQLGNLLYTNYLISIPMIFDLLVIYGKENSQVLSRVIQTIIQIQPKYETDLLDGLRYIDLAFKTIQQKIFENDSTISFDDLSVYALDCAMSISILLSVYPAANQHCLAIKLEQSISKFYDETIPELYKIIYLVSNTSVSLDYLNWTRMELIDSFRSLCNFCLDTVLNDPADRILPVEQFLAIIQEALSDVTFVTDYQKLYPVEIDIEMLQQACNELDAMKINFIIEAYISTQPGQSIEDDEAFAKKLNEQTNYYEDCDGIDSIDCPLNTQIKSIMDVLPHLDVSFVKKLITRYDNTEQAIAAVLEGNLPPDLHSNEELPIKNVIADIDFGGAMSSTSSNMIIKQGKGFPNQPKNLADLLNDKSHVQEFKQRYEMYSLIDDEDDYNDEYDDSYEAMAESETKVISKKNIVLDDVNDVDEEDEEEDDDSETEYRDQSITSNFCENPEVVRERLATTRNSRFAAKYKNKMPATQNHDVVGKQNGQGQDSNTQISRHKKEVNKTSRANHNRRQGAAWKRSRGMVPS